MQLKLLPSKIQAGALSFEDVNAEYGLLFKVGDILLTSLWSGFYEINAVSGWWLKDISLKFWGRNSSLVSGPFTKLIAVWGGFIGGPLLVIRPEEESVKKQIVNVINENPPGGNADFTEVITRIEKSISPVEPLPSPFKTWRR